MKCKSAICFKLHISKSWCLIGNKGVRDGRNPVLKDLITSIKVLYTSWPPRKGTLTISLGQHRYPCMPLVHATVPVHAETQGQKHYLPFSERMLKDLSSLRAYRLPQLQYIQGHEPGIMNNCNPPLSCCAGDLPSLPSGRQS